tara:strand:- start:753 stop:1169 length:417 start_codon:yes stop_codon:yes gene_type:complete
MKKLISNYFFKSFKRIILAFSLLPFFFFESKAEELIREFSGKRSITTSEFEVKAPWILDWRINSNYRETMGLEISLVDAKTGFLIGRIFKTKYAGNGVKLFNDSGRYRLRISSTLTDWNFKISQLSKSEAELYSPKIR